MMATGQSSRAIMMTAVGVLLVNVTLSAIAATIAAEKNRSWIGWFWLAYFIGALIVILVASAMQPLAGAVAAKPAAKKAPAKK